MEPPQDSVGTGKPIESASAKAQEPPMLSEKQTDNVGIKGTDSFRVSRSRLWLNLSSDNLFELVLTNDKGYGLFAVENISRGTCILVESPLMTTPLKPSGKGLLGMNIAGLVSKLKSLSPEQHETFFALYHNPDFIPGVKKRLRRELEEQKLSAPITLPDVCDPMTLVKVAAIYGSNMLKLGDDRELGTGVFPLYSPINYSCVPNLQAHYNPTTQKLIVHAVRYINKGEELLTKFHTNSCRTHEQRDAEFKARGFTCECKVCTGDDAAESNERRKAMLRLDLSLEAYDKSNKPRNTFEVSRNAGVALELAQELLELFKKEGILDCELQGL